MKKSSQSGLRAAIAVGMMVMSLWTATSGTATAQDARPAAPAAVVTRAKVKSLSKGGYYTTNQCAVLVDGQVLCWGENGSLELSSVSGVVSVPSTDAALSGLEINPGPLSSDPNFDSTRYHYYPVVPNAAASMLVTPTLRDANATYTITGSSGACTPATSPANCALSVGVNTITVTVTAEDGATKLNYVLHVERLGLPVVTTAKVRSLGRGEYYAKGQWAILADGQVLFWGEENFNQYGSRGSQTLPVTLTGVADAVDVTFGDSRLAVAGFSCAARRMTPERS